MRNYIRYIVVLVLIIAGGLLLISVVNKFTEPDVSKVNNNQKTEEKDTVIKDNDANLTLDITQTDDKKQESIEQSPSTTQPEQPQNTTDNIIVPNTGTKENVTLVAIGLITIFVTFIYIKKYTNN